MHDKGPGRLDVVDCLIEAMLRLGREAALDLDRTGTLPSPELAAGRAKTVSTFGRAMRGILLAT